MVHSILTKVNRSKRPNSNRRATGAHIGVYVAEEVPRFIGEVVVAPGVVVVAPIGGAIGAPRGVNVEEEVPSMNDLGSQSTGAPLSSMQAGCSSG